MKLAKNFKVRTESGFSKPINFAADSVFFDNEVSLKDKIGEGVYEGDSLSDAIVLAQDKVRLASTLGNVVDYIPKETDLDTIRELGTYRCRSGEYAKTFLNCPENDAFKMEVGYNAAYADTNQIYQLIITYAGNMYRRYLKQGSWTTWAQYLDDSVHLPANKGSFGLNTTADLGKVEHLERINNFVIEMNLTANKMGLTNSYFKTPSGLPRKCVNDNENTNNNPEYYSYTTAYDALRLLAAAKHTRAISKIMGTETYKYKYPGQDYFRTVEHTILANEDWKNWAADSNNNFTIIGGKGGSLIGNIPGNGSNGIMNFALLIKDNQYDKTYGVSILGLQNPEDDTEAGAAAKKAELDLGRQLIKELIIMMRADTPVRIDSKNIQASQNREYPVCMAIVELNKTTYDEDLQQINNLPIAYNGGVQKAAASITKLLTGIVAVQRIKNQYITINYHDKVGGSQSGFLHNSYLAAPDAFYIMLMKSANDLATAFARESNVEKKLPELSETKKKMIKALAKKYENCSADVTGGDGRFMYYGNTIRSSYFTDRCWATANEDTAKSPVFVKTKDGKKYKGQYGLCCNTFAEMVMMGRDPDDFKMEVSNTPINYMVDKYGDPIKYNNKNQDEFTPINSVHLITENGDILNKNNEIIAKARSYTVTASPDSIGGYKIINSNGVDITSKELATEDSSKVAVEIGNYYLRKPNYSPKITKYTYTIGQTSEADSVRQNLNKEHIVMDWGYYPDFQMRQSNGGLMKGTVTYHEDLHTGLYNRIGEYYNKTNSAHKTRDFIYNSRGLPNFQQPEVGSWYSPYTYYYHWINPNEDDNEIAHSYSASSRYDKDYDTETWRKRIPYAQFHSSHQDVSDLAYDLYRHGFEIPFEQLDIGDFIFTRPAGYHLQNEYKTFSNDMSWSNCGHVALIVDKAIKANGSIEYGIVECTTELGTHEHPICTSYTNGSYRWDRMQSEYLLRNTFLCVRHPAAWGMGNMKDRQEITWEEGALMLGTRNYPVMCKHPKVYNSKTEAWNSIISTNSNQSGNGMTYWNVDANGDTYEDYRWYLTILQYYNEDKSQIIEEHLSFGTGSTGGHPDTVYKVKDVFEEKNGQIRITADKDPFDNQYLFNQSFNTIRYIK